jgi:DNA-binding transcriptional LysR family regulator
LSAIAPPLNIGETQNLLSALTKAMEMHVKFDWTDLRLFLHVVEAGSITAGAVRAHLSLAAASERIRGMEDALGLALLVRSYRGVRPSAAGDTVVHHARLVFQQLARMEAELGDHAGGSKGTVRLLCNTAALSEYLPDALARFMARHAGVDIDIEERTSADVVKGVRDGSADIGIAADTVDFSSLVTFPFCTDRLVAVAAPRQLPGAGATVAFADLLALQHIALAGDSALSRYLAQQAASAGRMLHTRARVRSFDAICRMVETGIGIGIVPEAAALRCAASMTIVAVPLSDAWALRQLALCVRDVDRLPQPARQLIDVLKAA